MKFSIVTTIYNDESKIIRYLDNMTEQSIKAKEIVIVDGGSNDGSIKLIECYRVKSKIPIKLCKGKYNIAEGFNIGIREAQSDWCAITSVGVRYPKDFFECLVKELQSQPYLDAVYSLIRGEGNTFFSRLYAKNVCNLKNGESKATNRGVIIKKAVIEELGYFYEGLFYAGEDEELYQRFNNYGKKAKCCVTTSIYWEVPSNFKEFIKQTCLYGIGYMQIYSNDLIFKMYKKRIGYVFAFVSIILISILYEVFKFTGGGWLVIILLMLLVFYNAKWCIKDGFMSCMFRNAYYFISVFYIIKNYKYYLSKNKIDQKRIIKSINY